MDASLKSRPSLRGFRRSIRPKLTSKYAKVGGLSRPERALGSSNLLQGKSGESFPSRARCYKTIVGRNNSAACRDVKRGKLRKMFPA